MKLTPAKVVEIPFAPEPYSILLRPGKYLLEAYGASGGGGSSRATTARDPDGDGCYDQNNVTIYKGNTHCQFLNSQPGSGGYSRGTARFRHQTLLYINTGGAGVYKNTAQPGGYNGGGASCIGASVAGSGGGATDFRLFLNSLYTRILVAGGGGGSDDVTSATSQTNGGTGGSGGLIGQAMWRNGIYLGSSYETTTTTGFSFG